MEDKDIDSVRLTKRDVSILQKVALGLTTPQIASELNLSPETVKWYRKQLIMKFSASTSAEMVRKAVQDKIIR